MEEPSLIAFFLSKESSESAAKDAQSYSFFGPVFVDELEV